MNKGLKVGFHSWKELIRAKGRLALSLVQNSRNNNFSILMLTYGKNGNVEEEIDN